jgi:hypothetical protein
MVMKEDSRNHSAERSSLRSQGSSTALEKLSARELAKIYCEAMSSSLREGTSSDQYAVELFRRATRQGDQEAREALQVCFRATVRHWLNQHASKDAASLLNAEEQYITHAFARFWQFTTAQQLYYVHLSEALQYLRMSLNAVILDEVRTYSHRQEDFLQDPIDPAKPQVEWNFESAEIWEFLITLLSNEREQRLAYLLFHCGLKPKEIVHLYPLEFDDMREISHVRCSIFKRFLDHLNGPPRLIPSAKPGNTSTW